MSALSKSLAQTPRIDVIPAAAVKLGLTEMGVGVIGLVARTFLDHAQGRTVNPDSNFLRFPARPSDRIIALPASIDRSDLSVSGLKWISSYPRNHDRGLPRASAVLVLNDHETGYPFAVLEGARISAVRTAASAVLGARWLAPNGGCHQASTLSICGTGVIAHAILDLFAADGWSFDRVLLFDTSEQTGEVFCDSVRETTGFDARLVSEREARRADIVVYTTTSTVPHVLPDEQFGIHQLVLHISLRDLAPETIYSSENYFDDVDHCLKANTSAHLAEQKYGDRSFVTGTIADVMQGHVRPSREKPAVFSPFGMGILDLAIGHEVWRMASKAGAAIPIDNFFFEGSRC